MRRIPPEPGSRAVYVQLTDPGHGAVEDAVSRLLTYEQQLVDILDPQDQEELARLLSIFLSGLVRRAGSQGSPAEDRVATEKAGAPGTGGRQGPPDGGL